MSKVIVVTSGKGGVGKTTTVANIGMSLAMQGKKVVLVDADIGLRNLDVVMGLENRIVFDIIDVINKNCRLQQALIKHKKEPNLSILPASQSKDKNAISVTNMVKLCEELKEVADFVIIDCPAGIEQGFKNAVAGADEALVGTTPEVSAVRDADRIIGLLQASGIAEPQLVVNRIRTNMVQRGDMMDIQDILDILAIKLLGIVPDDEDIIVSTNKGEPVVLVESSLPGQAYRNISGRLLGENIPLLDIHKPQGFLAKLMNIFKSH